MKNKANHQNDKLLCPHSLEKKNIMQISQTAK